MDNVTHSLIGFTLGRAVSKKGSQFRIAATWTAILGNNLPDLDFLIQPFVIQGKLGYLLHHRGYTHTLFLSLFLGPISAVLGAKLSGYKKWFCWELLLLGWISIMLHILADYCNNYGVHPFSPIQNQWFYGDFLFIVEPTLWLSILPLLYFSAQTKITQGIAIGLEAALLGLIWTQIFNPWPVALGLSVWALMFGLVQRLTQSALPSMVGVLFVLMSFQLASLKAKSQFSLLASNSETENQVHQLTSTPAPGNPFCWSLISLSIQQNKDYVARVGIVSLAPSVFNPRQCYFRQKEAGLADLHPISLPTDPSIFWIGEYRRPLQEFLELQENSCRFRALLKFARVPVWKKENGNWIAADLRYDQKEGGFTRTELDSRLPCPDSLPPWIPPALRFD
jgi:inner membrane protein